ncbi:MAG: hypothetical protein IKK46_08715 [Clostridia bacterium]|nr:hypothetical protein [Clostridia bacterium]MBR3810366.1 hypothetical protein [Clostridia bacterium]
MIILKLNSEVNVKRPKNRKLKRRASEEKLFDYSRSGIVINNKPHFVISVSPDTLEDLEFQKLISKYKGSVVASENLEKIDWLREILFDLKPFRKKILFESLKNKLKNKEFINFNLLIIDYDLTLLGDIQDVLPFIKNIGILTHSKNNTTEWENNCFSKYGVKPVFIRNEHFLNMKNYDVIADFEKIDDNKLHLNVSGEEAILYPFFKFLEVPEELKILENLDLSKTTICGAFKGA